MHFIEYFSAEKIELLLFQVAEPKHNALHKTKVKYLADK